MRACATAAAAGRVSPLLAHIHDRSTELDTQYRRLDNMANVARRRPFLRCKQPVEVSVLATQAARVLGFLTFSAGSTAKTNVSASPDTATA